MSGTRTCGWRTVMLAFGLAAAAGAGFGVEPQSALDAMRPEAPVGVAPGESGFTLKLTADLGSVKEREVLFELPGAVEVWVRDETGSGGNQNYGNFRCEDGRCPVLEARVFLHSAEHPDWKEMTIGVPLSRLEKRAGPQEITLQFAGARWQMRVGGLYDEDFPFGKVKWQPETVWSLKSPRATAAALWNTPLKDQPRAASQPVKRIQYFTPEGHNAWVGDVATGFQNGRFHVFYLIDRRHHGSKFGCGGHYFAHLSSTDLKNWVEHEPAADLDEQWETIGTGTPFVYKNKLHLSYGLHTTRLYPREKTLLPAMHEYIQKNGRTGVFKRSDYGAVPAGMTYSVSEDGITFTKSHVMLHPSENPTLYGRPDGTLVLYGGYGADGLWEARSLPGEFVCVDTGFPLKSMMEPCTDCPCAFEWNGRRYLIEGFSGFWSSPDGKSQTYVDLAAEGRDIYDGLGVPMVAEFKDNRRIMGGWLGGQGWGGHLVLRELVQLEDGTVGLKWPAEVLPPMGAERSVTQEATLGGEGLSFDAPEKGSLLLSMTVDPGKATSNGVFAVRLLGADGKSGCELQVDTARGRAQWSDAMEQGFAKLLPSGREIMKAKQAGEAWAANGRNLPIFHSNGRNFCIEQVRGLNKPFTLRVMVFRDPKMNGSVVDAEIAGQRTLVSCRPDLLVKRASLVAQDAGVQVRQVTCATPEM